MENAHIIINFPKPGNWTKFTVVAEWTDSEGWSKSRTTSPEQIPAEHLEVLEQVVQDIRALGQPWTATHVVARLSSPATRVDVSGQLGGHSTEPDAVELTCHVRSDEDANSRRSFTYTDIPALLVTGEDAVNAFKHFIN